MIEEVEDNYIVQVISGSHFANISPEFLLNVTKWVEKRGKSDPFLSRMGVIEPAGARNKYSKLTITKKKHSLTWWR